MQSDCDDALMAYDGELMMLFGDVIVMVGVTMYRSAVRCMKSVISGKQFGITKYNVHKRALRGNLQCRVDDDDDDDGDGKRLMIVIVTIVSYG